MNPSPETTPARHSPTGLTFTELLQRGLQVHGLDGRLSADEQITLARWIEGRLPA